MTLSSILSDKLRLPLIAAPMFLVSGPNLVIAQCKAGIVGSFPALNARSAAQLDEWLTEIAQALTAHDRAYPEAPAAPFAVNLIVHRTNTRLEEDLAACARFKVPIVITSLGARTDVIAAVRAWGGIVLHDVITDRFARKAIEKGADGLIAVAAGAGGHAGVQSPFALMQEIRAWFDGPVALSGAIANGASILAARAIGADLAYIGSAFIATKEANAVNAYKKMIVASSAEDIVYTNHFTGIHANYLRPSIERAGIDSDVLVANGLRTMVATSSGNAEAKPWRDIWGCGQGIGPIDRIQTVADLVEGLTIQFDAALAALTNRHGRRCLMTGTASS